MQHIASITRQHSIMLTKKKRNHKRLFELIKGCRPALGQVILVHGTWHVLIFSCTGHVQRRVNGNSIISILDIQSKGTQDADANENAFCVLCVLVYYTIRVFVYLYVHTYAYMHRAFVPALWQGRAAHKTCVICAIAMCLHIHVLHVFVIHSNFEYTSTTPQQQGHCTFNK